MNTPLLKKLALLTAVAIMAQGSAMATEAAARADIVFKGSSTLHDFEGKVAAKPFAAVIAEDQETGKLRVSAKTSLNIKDMTTENGKRDANMYKMFDMDHFKTIEGTLAETLICEEQETIAMLHLKMHGNEQDVKAKLSGFQQEGNLVSCNMTFPVSLTAFGLKPPSVMGFIKVDDTVQIECRITGTLTKNESEG